MNLAILVVYKELDGGEVDGGWLQDCTGKTLEEATEVAHRTSEANGNKLTLALVEGPTPQGKRFFYQAKPLVVVRAVQPSSSGSPD